MATITPMERPEEMGEKMTITPAEAAKFEKEQAERFAEASQDSDPDRQAPPEGENANCIKASDEQAESSGGILMLWMFTVLVSEHPPPV